MPIVRPSGKKHPSDRWSPRTAWFHAIKNTREAAIAEADRNITEKKVKNEELISHKLKSIHLGDSALPPDVLEEKTYVEQPCGNIEYQVSGAIKRIENNTQKYTGLDIRKIDNGIYQIAFLAKQAIDGGNAYAARTACYALNVTIGEIRDKIPFVPVNVQKEFADSAKQYIDLWIDCILYGTVLDGLLQNTRTAEETVNRMQEELEQKKNELAERLANDMKLRQEFEIIRNEKYEIFGNTWNVVMIELYRQLLDLRIRDSSLAFEILCHNDNLQKVIVHKRVLDGFLSKLRTVPQPQDKNLMDKFHDLIHEVSMKMDDQKRQLEEFFQEMDRTDAMITQLVNFSVTLRAKEAASRQIDEMLEQAKKKQLETYGTAHNDRVRRLYTDEEMQAQKSTNDAAEQP